jgi:hypothetical protein
MEDTDVLRRLARLHRDTEARLAELRAEHERLTAAVAAPAPVLDIAEQDRRLALALDRDALLDRKRADDALAAAEQARAEHARGVAEHRDRVAAAHGRLAEVAREVMRHEQLAEAAGREVAGELARIGRSRLESAKASVYGVANALVAALAEWRAVVALADADSPHASARSPRGFELVIPKCETADRPEGAVAPFAGFADVVLDAHAGAVLAERRLAELRAELLGEE